MWRTTRRFKAVGAWARGLHGAWRCSLRACLTSTPARYVANAEIQRFITTHSQLQSQVNENEMVLEVSRALAVPCQHHEH